MLGITLVTSLTRAPHCNVCNIALQAVPELRPFSQLTTYLLRELRGPVRSSGCRELGLLSTTSSGSSLLPACVQGSVCSLLLGSWYLLSLCCIHSFRIFFKRLAFHLSQGNVCWGGNIAHELKENTGRRAPSEPPAWWLSCGS